MRFEKWQGLGNDFVLVGREITPEIARLLCDRRLGIGADGVLCIDRNAPAMIVLNADGSRPEMCGNGLRCVAGWLAERGERNPAITVMTDAGPRACTMTRLADGHYDVCAHMGAASVQGEMSFEGRRFILVDVGNPHAVCFETLNAGEADRLGPALESHVDGGVNVELVSPSAGGFTTCVFERGVGWTDACGTGACAVAAAAVSEGLAAADEVVNVLLPGGTLAIEITSLGVQMRGPAKRVFVGEYILDDHSAS